MLNSSRGPMLGYNTMKEVAVWVQLEKEDTVQFRYFEQGK